MQQLSPTLSTLSTLSTVPTLTTRSHTVVLLELTELIKRYPGYKNIEILCQFDNQFSFQISKIPYLPLLTIVVSAEYPQTSFQWRLHANIHTNIPEKEHTKYDTLKRHLCGQVLRELQQIQSYPKVSIAVASCVASCVASWYNCCSTVWKGFLSTRKKSSH
jgi:hypothetical protein